jgi:hypothetical protein
LNAFSLSLAAIVPVLVSVLASDYLPLGLVYIIVSGTFIEVEAQRECGILI